MLSIEVLADEGLVLCVIYIGTENKMGKEGRCRILERRCGQMREDLTGQLLGFGSG